MAQTGRTDIGITPVTETDVTIIPMLEGASITAAAGPVGALVNNVSGYITVASGAVTSAWGYAFEAFHNIASDGLRKVAIARLEQGKEYEIQLNGTAAVTDTDVKCAVTQTSGVPVVAITDTSADGRITRLAPGWAVGDVNPRVYVIFFDSFIEQSGGNE